MRRSTADLLYDGVPMTNDERKALLFEIAASGRALYDDERVNLSMLLRSNDLTSSERDQLRRAFPIEFASITAEGLGKPAASKNNGCLIGAVIVGVLIFLGVIGSHSSAPTQQSATTSDAGQSSDTNNGSNSSSDSAAAPPVQAGGSTSHNWSADIGGLQFNIKNVAVHSVVGDPDNEMEQDTAKGQFIVVQLQVANHSRKSATVAASDFHLERNGQEYDATDSVATMTAGGFTDTNINPGLQHTGLLVFDVPTGSSPGKFLLEVYGNGSDGSQDKQMISLAKTE